MAEDCIDHGKPCDGYYKVGNTWLHRIVLAGKLGRELEEYEVTRHTCDNRRCINPEHLIVGSAGDNVRDAFERGRMPVGSKHYLAKLDEDIVLYLREVYIPRHKIYGTRALARLFNVSQWTISHAIRGLTWRHI